MALIGLCSVTYTLAFVGTAGGYRTPLQQSAQHKMFGQYFGFATPVLQHRDHRLTETLSTHKRFRRSPAALLPLSSMTYTSSSPHDSVSKTEEVNDLLVERLLLLLESGEWKQIADKNGVKVWKKRAEHGYSWPHGTGPANSTGRFDAVKAVTVLDCPPSTVVEVFRDNSKCQEYNEFFAEMDDVVQIDENTKIVWSATERIGPLRARDFATRVHFRTLPDGTELIANLAEQVSCSDQRAAGKQSKYCRMEMLLGGHIVRSVPGSPSKCEYTQITHANPGGALDSKVGAFLANAAAAGGPIEVLASLRDVTSKMAK